MSYISNKMVQRICGLAQKSPKLKEFSLNLENRHGIDSEAYFFIKELLEEKKNLKLINISFKGTQVDELLADKLKKEISKRENLHLGRILY